MNAKSVESTTKYKLCHRRVKLKQKLNNKVSRNDNIPPEQSKITATRVSENPEFSLKIHIKNKPNTNGNNNNNYRNNWQHIP